MSLIPVSCVSVCCSLRSFCMETVIVLSSRVVPVYRSTIRGGIGWEGGREGGREGGGGGRREGGQPALQDLRDPVY